MKLHLAALADLLSRYGRAFRVSWQHRKELDTMPRRPEEAEFLPSVLALQDSPTGPAPHVAMWMIIGLLLLTVLWASFGRIDIVAVASGRVVAAGNTKIVQAPTNAVITEIKVDDGQPVKAGDVLLTLDAESQQADISQLSQSMVAARLSTAQGQALQQAIDSGRVPTLPVIEGIPTSLANEAQMRLTSQYNEYISNRQQLNAQIEQQQQQQQSVREQLRNIANTLPLIRQQETDYQNMLNKDYLPRHTLLDKQRERIQLEGSQAVANSRLNELSAAITALEKQKNALTAQFRRSALDTAQQGLEQIEQIKPELIKAEQQNRLMTITAPVSGTIQQLAVHTVGGTVTPAQALMAIVPNDATVEVDALVENKDIGFVQVGQHAAVKVDTFKFTKYGIIPAHIASISQDAIDDEQRGPVYSARIALERDTLDVDGRTVRLSPGMTVSVEIKTGQRRVIEYFLTPLLQNGSESLKER